MMVFHLPHEMRKLSHTDTAETGVENRPNSHSTVEDGTNGTQDARRRLQRIVSLLSLLPLVIAFTAIAFIAVWYLRRNKKERGSNDGDRKTHEGLETFGVNSIRGSAHLQLKDGASTNNRCEEATFFPFTDLPRTFRGSLSEAGTQVNGIRGGSEECGITPDTLGDWYTFVGNGKLTHIAYSNAYGNDALVSLFRGAACDALVCEDHFGSTNLIIILPESGVEYWLLVARRSQSMAADNYEYELSMNQRYDG